MTETKSEAFHRLATRRVEDIEDKIRILSNLANPGYVWTPDEVMAYVERIQGGLRTMLERFTDTKQWREASPLIEAPAEADDGDEAEIEDDMAAPAPQTAATPIGRDAAMAAILKELGPHEEAMVEMIAMQREVIGNLQAMLDERRKPST